MTFGPEMIKVVDATEFEAVTRLILDCVQQSSSSLSIDDLNEILKIYSVQADSSAADK